MEPRHGARYTDILALARATEDAGFDAFFRSDHLMGVDPADPTYLPTECWTTLGGIARETSRVRLGVLVGAATFRWPGLLAAAVASASEMSGGRVELGLGTGWYEREHAAFGIPFPATGKERFDRLAEQLAIVTGMWRTPDGESFSFAGAHYSVAANRTPPRPDPVPPVIVGGTGARRTPAIAARFADEFNGALARDGAELAARYALFDRACAEIGRDPGTARRSVVVPVACGATPAEVRRRAAVIGSELMRSNAAIGSPDAVAEHVDDLTAAGADTVYLHIYDIHDLDHIALIGAEVLARLGTVAAGPATAGTAPPFSPSGSHR
ncbi:TIGR03560 family F420-dependent LLM class oxidoreductase [Pseudonocardia humida]|uniref:TIGR03560 family F420-dependent LLM class oxidoreductase n=1 Tax=Pseudonocardia humida TaxID=2800819 RepID=A0ABT0ZZL8_9PSEU|nr:TIGR03560 family F420-dependent LLM class oxidoreductase [Pseudonocardia humida]MCO1656118.1 TIGR03560 family F420-dependent LLM class oxidoreductase [Pseudonocardia humida]